MHSKRVNGVHPADYKTTKLTGGVESEGSISSAEASKYLHSASDSAIELNSVASNLTS